MMKVNRVFVEEWQYSFDSFRGLSLEQFMHEYDETESDFERRTVLMERVDALSDDVPGDLLRDALEWAESVEDMDWARHDRKWIDSHRDIAIATKRYREFTADDADVVVHTVTSRGSRSRKAKPEFRHRGKSYVLNDGFLDDFKACGKPVESASR